MINPTPLKNLAFPASVLTCWLLISGISWADLSDYDGIVIAEEVSEGLVPVAKLTAAVSFNGSNGSAFNFGVNSGAVSMEFVVEGDPVAGGLDGFLAMGANSSSTLRYEQWADSGQMGFTQAGIADYFFSPLVLSPTVPTHICYVWNGSGHMDLYYDGVLIGQRSSVSASFDMPTGLGKLGNNSANTEGMVGTIHRVTVYDQALDAAAISRHADAYNDVLHPPVIADFSASPEAYLAPGTATLSWDVTGEDTLSLNGSDVSGSDFMVVAPATTTLYTLTATNADGAVFQELTVTVDPAPVIESFSGDRSIINAGETVTLSWETEFATTWSIAPVPGSVTGQTSGGDGSVLVSPTGPVTYTLTASSAFGSTTADFSVDVAVVADHLVISEFMADNDTGLTDGDGEYSDWIEIFNPTGGSIDLAGYYLTDDSGDLTQWVFPSHILVPGGRVIVFASSKDPLGPVGELHTNFRLSKSGEYLALVAPNGTTVVHEYSPGYPPQSSDVSYGILAGDLAREQFMGVPTPGAENDASPPDPEAVVFSQGGQTFTGTLQVDLSSTASGATIYFTTDGSAPSSTNGTEYVSSVSVSATTHLRAVAVLAGQTSVVSGAQFVRLAADLVGYESDLPLLVIDNFGAGTIPAKGWSGTGGGVQQVARHSAMWATFDRDPVTGMAALGDAPQMISRVGIRGRGAFSSSWTQKPYNAEAWDESSEERNVEVLGMPAHSDWILYYPDTDTNKDPSMMFNTFMYELARDIGHDAMRLRWVEAFVNEDGGDLALADRRGVYAVMEKVSRGADRLDFERLSDDGTTGGWMLDLNRMDSIPVGGYPTANGATSPQFFHTKGPNRASESSPNSGGGGDDIPRQSNGYLNFDNPGGYKMTVAQRGAIEGWFDTFEDVLYDNGLWLDPVDGYTKYLDARDFAEYFIFNNLSRNGDGMLISMFPWVGDDGKLRMGPAWDYNWASYYVGGGATGSKWHRSDRLWYGRLFTDPDFEQLYIDLWFMHRDGAMSNAGMEAIIDGQAAEIGEERALRQGFTSSSAWTNELNTFKTWLTTRADWYDGQFLNRPVFDTPGGEIPVGFMMTFASTTGTIYYTTDGSDPRASGGSLSAGTQTYGSAVELTSSVYVTARTRLAGEWSAPRSAYFSVGSAAGDPSKLVVSEIHYRPAAVTAGEIAAGFTDRDQFEFIELMNTGTEPLNITGMRLFRDGNLGIDFEFSGIYSRTLAAGERVLVVKNRAAFEFRYGTGLSAQIAGEYLGKLNNDGDTLSLLDASDAVLLVFTYNDKSPWPEEADGDGHSLVLSDQGQAVNPDHNDPINWRASVNVGGSPGSTDGTSYAAWKLANGIPTPETDFDLDGDGRDNVLEFVEGTQALVSDQSLGLTLTIESIDVGGLVEDYHVFRFHTSLLADGVAISLDRSQDLENWLSGPAAAVFLGRERTGPTSENLVFRSANPASSEVLGFARIRVQAN